MYVQLNKDKMLYILVPAYNCAEYIEECLDSIANQTLFKNNSNYRILLGIDGCKKTLSKVKKIKNNYSNLEILYCKENKGTYITLNTLLSTIDDGNFIVFGADDTMNKNMIEEIMKIGRMGIVRSDGVLVAPVKVVKKFGCFMPWRCAGDSELIDRMTKTGLEINRYRCLFFRRYHENQITKSKEYGHTSKIRDGYKLIIASNRPYKITPVINKFKYLDKIKISFNIATYPARLESFKKVIQDVYNKVDIIRVCLNEYTAIPEFLNRKKITVVIPDKDLKDCGKFIWANENRNEYYFTGDDDILYSKEYFDNHIRKLKEYNDKIIVSSHGRIIREDAEKLTHSDPGMFFHCLKDVDENHFVNIGGTGVMVMNLKYNKINISDYDCIGYVDLGMAVHAIKTNTPILVRGHSKNELEYILERNSTDTLFAKRDADKQIDLIRIIRQKKLT